jgi:2-oxoglutarate/2-oxoacid ferredoxin oxidoreductase subunit alpha
MSRVVATFAGDSGDGVQLLGNAFSDFIATLSFEYNTLPDFPAEIRAPAGKLFGVSGFQIQWGDEAIQTAGNHCDILVAFNAAAFKKYKNNLKSNGLLVYDPSGFDSKNCKLAEFEISDLENFAPNKVAVEFSLLAKNALSETDLTEKDKDKNKNIFALGFLVFGVGGQLDIAKSLLENKFMKDPAQLNFIHHVLSSGYNFAETIEFSFHHAKPQNKVIERGNYRNITGNNAIVLALAAAPKIFGRNLF